MRCARVLLALALTPALLAQPPKPVAPKPKPLPGSITGTVLCADTNTPARGATIFIQPVPDANGKDPATLNSISHAALDGTYMVSGVAPGTYIVVAVQPGYLSDLTALQEASATDAAGDPPAQRIERVAAFPHVVVEANKPTRFDMQLQPAATLSGTVRFDDGSPAVGATIHLENPAPVNDDEDEKTARLRDPSFRDVGETTFASQNFITDDRGRYRIASLAPGSYSVSVTVAAGKPLTYDQAGYGTLVEQTLGSLRVYAGSTVHRADAAKFDLTDRSEVTGADITIPLTSFHRVRGTLTSIDGRLLDHARMSLQDTSDPNLALAVYLAEDGSFEFPTVIPGTYRLFATQAAIQGSPTYDKDFERNLKAQFADGSMDVIVEDVDLRDVTLTLKEVPLPPKPKGKDHDDDE